MKKSIIYYKNTDNIGDDIQTYAALKLLGDVDYFVDRESLNQPGFSEESKLLCNGWFMKNPENWPPASNLIPLFISMYIDHKHQCYEKMLSPELIPYYQNHAPVGCRDKNTLKLFQNLNIESYFSACVTLTLPEYKGEKSNEILFVDPFVKIFDKKYVQTQIQRLIPKELAQDVTVLSHHDDEIQSLTIEQRMQKVEKLIHRYAKAKLIVTSRIHCALPATALGTPVYFMDVGYDRKHSHERLQGLIDLFEVVDNENFPVSSNQPWAKIQRKLGLYSKKPILNNPIDFELNAASRQNFEENFKKAKIYADEIKEKVQDFFKEPS